MRAAEYWAAAIAQGSAAIGREVRIDPMSVLDRRGDLPLRRPGLWSPNRSCRLIRAVDGWLAVNLPREDDRDLVPAWLGREIRGDPWQAIRHDASRRCCVDLRDDAALLGLAVSIVGEAKPEMSAVTEHRLGQGTTRSSSALRVIDLTSMWAGPLCGSVLAEAGATVTRFESVHRPDPARMVSPAFHERLNGAKTHIAMDFTNGADRGRLADAIAAADMVLTSARPRAFDALAITPDAMIARNPGLIWVAITGHGWFGEGAGRIAFGDDAAAAGGLVRWTASGEPRFAGDALADPLTGLAAGAAALSALRGEGGILIDVALARVAADAARRQAQCPRPT